jgi:hypothetical protein
MTTARVHGTADTIAHLRQTLVAEATEAFKRYPQYEGHWDGWRVAEITRRVRTKLGVAFEAGDLVLVAPETHTERIPPRDPFEAASLPYEDWPTKEFASAYSRRNGITTAVPVAYVREIRAEEETR